MIRNLLLLLLFITFQLYTYSQSYSIDKDVKRILFLGNSITYQGKYIEDISIYLTVKYPNKKYEIVNLGLPSETVSGLSESNHANGEFPRPDLHERLKSILAKIQPDLVFACYGMNDGIYLPFAEKRFNKYKKGMNWLHKKLIESGASVIHITPPIYDEIKGKAYANVLDIYSDWLLSKQFTDEWNVIDIHWPMKKELEKRRSIDSTFVFAKDGIHPNYQGHFLMAQQILLYLGETEIKLASSIQQALAFNGKSEELIELITKQQRMMKDAWLTEVGHTRPNMKLGLPINNALQKYKELDEAITKLLMTD